MSRISRPPTWLGPALLIALLGVLGSLQVRWLSEVRDADHARTMAQLRRDIERFTGEFNGELEDLILAMQPRRRVPSGKPLLADAWHAWRETAEYPDLLAGVFLLTVDDGSEADPSEATGSETEASETTVWSVDPRTTTLVEAQLPSTLVPALASWTAASQARRTATTEDGRHRDDPRPERRLPPPSILPTVPAIIVPYFGPSPAASTESPRARETTTPRGTDRARRLSGDRRPGPGERRPVLILQLDRDVLFDAWLPALANRHFGDSPSFQMRIVPAEPTDATTRPLFLHGPDVPADAEIDAAAPIFGPLRFGQPGRRDPRGRRVMAALAAFNDLGRGHWRLEAAHPAGSLDASLDRTRWLNLALVFGILGILGATVVQLSISARRTRELAKRQLDFVAGVTHELRTPLAALRSAGQNLADGVVADGDPVRRYGQLIDREAGRLSDLVAQTLAFARLQSAGTALDLDAVEPAVVLAAVAEAQGPALDADGIALEVEVEPDLPAIHGDRRAIERILGNLVSNAAKYGQPTTGDGPGWIGLEARKGDPTSVELVVRDRGQGIDPRDRSRLFEPFVRGRGLAASAIPGSGLGLALVRQWTEAQNGRVVLSSTPGGGATFTVTLPIAETTDAEPTVDGAPT